MVNLIYNMKMIQSIWCFSTMGMRKLFFLQAIWLTDDLFCAAGARLRGAV